MLSFRAGCACPKNALTQSVGVFHSKGDDENVEEWARFEVEQMRISVDNVGSFMNFIEGVWFTLVMVGKYQSLDNAFIYSIALAIWSLAVVCLWLVRRKIRSVKESSRTEWWLCLLHQIVCIAFVHCNLLALCLSDDTMFQHRAFCLAYVLATTSTAHLVYLPLPLRLIAVNLSACLTWLLFHWIVDFIKPVPILLCVLLPAIEVYGFRILLGNRWHSFSVLVRERMLKERFKCVLKTTYDASCECDKAGHILCSSGHLQDILGCSKNDILDSNLSHLAANTQEAKRMETFLERISEQHEGGRHSIWPVSLLQTSLRSWHPEVNTQLKVKMFAVLLPSDYTVSDCVPLPGNGWRFFVGIRRDGAWDGMDNASEVQQQGSLSEWTASAVAHDNHVPASCTPREASSCGGDGASSIFSSSHMASWDGTDVTLSSDMKDLCVLNNKNVAASCTMYDGSWQGSPTSDDLAKPMEEIPFSVGESSEATPLEEPVGNMNADHLILSSDTKILCKEDGQYVLRSLHDVAPQASVLCVDRSSLSFCLHTLVDITPTTCNAWWLTQLEGCVGPVRLSTQACVLTRRADSAKARWRSMHSCLESGSPMQMKLWQSDDLVTMSKMWTNVSSTQGSLACMESGRMPESRTPCFRLQLLQGHRYAIVVHLDNHAPSADGKAETLTGQTLAGQNLRSYTAVSARRNVSFAMPESESRMIETPKAGDANSGASYPPNMTPRLSSLAQTTRTQDYAWQQLVL